MRLQHDLEHSSSPLHSSQILQHLCNSECHSNDPAAVAHKQFVESFVNCNSHETSAWSRKCQLPTSHRFYSIFATVSVMNVDSAAVAPRHFYSTALPPKKENINRKIRTFCVSLRFVFPMFPPSAVFLAISWPRQISNVSRLIFLKKM